MRRMLNDKEIEFLQNLFDKIEITNDTTITIGTNLIVDGKVVATTIPSTAELEDGTYTLQCTVLDGVASFEWISA